MKRTPLTSTIEGLAKFNKNLDSILIEEARKDGGEIVKLQEAQMFEGKTSEGTDITPPYTYKTIQIKAEKHQIADRVTLRDTGAFYAGIKLDGRKKSITVSSSDRKTKKLKAKYGDEIFGLNEEKKGTFIQTFLKPRMQTRFKQAIGIN